MKIDVIADKLFKELINRDYNEVRIFIPRNEARLDVYFAFYNSGDERIRLYKFNYDSKIIKERIFHNEKSFERYKRDEEIYFIQKNLRK